MDGKENPKDNRNTNNGSQEVNQCLICHNPITDRSLTDTCLHEFCYHCLYESSRHNNRCPFCRREYRNIIHNIRSMHDFQQTPVVDINPNQEQHLMLAFLQIIAHLFVIRNRLLRQRDNVSQSLQHLNQLLQQNQNQENIRNAINSMNQLMEELNTSIADMSELLENIDIIPDNDFQNQIVEVVHRRAQRVSTDDSVESIDSLIAEPTTSIDSMPIEHDIEQTNHVTRIYSTDSSILSAPASSVIETESAPNTSHEQSVNTSNALQTETQSNTSTPSEQPNDSQSSSQNSENSSNNENKKKKSNEE